MTTPTTLPGWGKATAGWGLAAGTRALKTLIQTFVGAISGTALFTSVDWKVIGTSAVVAAAASFAQSLDGLPEVPTGAAPLEPAPTANTAPAQTATDATPEPAWPVDTTDSGQHRA